MWILFIFYDKQRTKLIKQLSFNSIKEISYVSGMKSQTISNYYHDLIKARGVLEYCILYQEKKNN